MSAKHTMYTFRLHRMGVILVALGIFLVATLLVVGGCMVGVWRAEERAGAAGARVAGGAAARSGSAARGGAPSAPSVPSAGAVSGIAMPAGAMAPAPATERFTLRVGAFTKKEDAKALVDALTARGYKPSINEVQASTGTTVFTVVVGIYTTRWEARGAAAELSRREHRDVVVVPVS